MKSYLYTERGLSTAFLEKRPQWTEYCNFGLFLLQVPGCTLRQIEGFKTRLHPVFFFNVVLRSGLYGFGGNMLVCIGLIKLERGRGWGGGGLTVWRK